MVIYLDVVFAINLVIDFLLLLFTTFVLRETFRPIRFLVSACIGALYTLFLFFPEFQTLWSIAAKIGLSILMMLVAYPWRGPLTCIKRLMAFYLVSCGLGGIAYALAYFIGSASALNTGVVLVSKNIVTTNMILIALFLSPVLLTYFGKQIWKHMQQNKQLESGIWTLTMTVGGKELTCSGLLDTGNGLTDPISKMPVTVVTYDRLRPILPATLVEKLDQKPSNLMQVITEFEWEDDWLRRVKMVPYRAVGTAMGMMIAFQADSVQLQKGDKIIRDVKTLIGISTQAMSKHERFEAILHPSVVEHVLAS
jgi:stage II sporulation protein GA (sporulation sigma-E factor processing peptidase)